MFNMSGEELTVPEKENTDYLHTIITKSISAASAFVNPALGIAVDMLISDILPAPLEKRRDLFNEQVAQAINHLQKKLNLSNGELVEKLKTNNVFISTVMELSKQAISEHREEKIRKIKNMLINSALWKNEENIIEFNKLLFVLSIEELLVFIEMVKVNGKNNGRTAIQGIDPEEFETGIWVRVYRLMPIGNESRSSLPVDTLKKIQNSLLNAGLIKFSKSHTHSTGVLNSYRLEITPFGEEFYLYVDDIKD